MQKLWIQAAMMLGGVLRGAVGGALGYLNTLLKSGFTTAMQFHQEGIAFARELGMNAKEAQAYTAVLTERTERLAMTYGVAAEQVKELQRNISVATSRQLMLNESQAEHFLQLNKLVGSSTVNQFTEQMMNGMGGSLDAVTGAVSKAYTTAAKSGLNAQKVSEKIASNLGMANRLSFRNGVEGLTRMAMQAEKMGMSLQSVESAAGQFLELDKSIENAAKMQMLGGSAAVSFGNPLTAAYEANYDPEAFAKRLQDSLASYATFNAQSGVASVNGMNMDFVRNIASVMGISAEEATRMAKKQAEVRYKEQNISGAYKGMGLSQEQIDFLINKSNVANGKVEFTTSEGQKVDLSSGQAISKAVLDEMMKYEGKSDRDIMEENAKSLTSINEQLIGIKDSIIAMFAKFVQGMFPDMQVDIKNFGQWAKNNLEPTAKNIGVAARGVYDWFTQNKEPIKTALSGLTNFISFVTSKWEWLVTFLIGNQLLKGFKNTGIIGNGTNAASKASGAAANPTGVWGKAKQAYNSIRHPIPANPALTRGTKLDALKAGAKAGGKAFLKTGGIGLGVGLVGMTGNYLTDKAAENGTIEKGGTAHTALKAVSTGAEYAAIGATIGSIIPGVGTGIGAGAGFVAGAIKGFWDAQKQKGEAKSKAEAHAEGGIVGGNSTSGDKVLTRLNSGEMVLNMSQQTKLFNAINSLKAPSINNSIGNYSFNRISNLVNGVTPKPTKIEAKPVGEREYIYTPKGNETSNVNGNTITVKDFNINLTGTLKLDGGNNSKNVDINALLNDQKFINGLKEMIKTSINQDMHGGRYMSDLATMRGHSSSLTTING